MNDLMLVDGGNETVSIAFTGGRERKPMNGFSVPPHSLFPRIESQPPKRL